MQGHSKSSRDISVWDVCRAPHSATKKDREHRRGQRQRLLAKLTPSTDRVTDIRRAWSSVDASCRVVSNRDRPHIIPNRAPPLIACGLSYAGQHARGALSSSRALDHGLPQATDIPAAPLSTVPPSVHPFVGERLGSERRDAFSCPRTIRLRTEQTPGPLDPSSPCCRCDVGGRDPRQCKALASSLARCLRICRCIRQFRRALTGWLRPCGWLAANNDTRTCPLHSLWRLMMAFAGCDAGARKVAPGASLPLSPMLQASWELVLNGQTTRMSRYLPCRKHKFSSPPDMAARGQGVRATGLARGRSGPLHPPVVRPWCERRAPGFPAGGIIGQTNANRCRLSEPGRLLHRRLYVHYIVHRMSAVCWFWLDDLDR
jgi:hypothetical protein